MTPLKIEGVYASTGPQRPVFLCPNAQKTEFFLQGKWVQMQVTYDPPENVKQKRCEWVVYANNVGDVLQGPPTAVRVVVRRKTFPIRLFIEQNFNQKEMHS